MKDAGEVFGREGDLEDLVDALDRHRVVILDGPRGVGKTELLEQVSARRGARRAYWVPLDGASTLEDAVATLRRRVGDDRSVSDRVVDFFQGTSAEEQLVHLLVRRGAGPRLAVLLDEVPGWLDRLGPAGPKLLTRLVGLALPEETTLLLTGSYGMTDVAAAFGVRSGAHRVRLAPIPAGAGQALFQLACAHAASEGAGRRATELAGGLPRWIERLGQHTRRPAARLVDEADVNEAIGAIVADATTFADDLAHLRRLPHPGWARAYLDELATSGAGTAARVAVVAKGATRSDVDRLVARLCDDQILASPDEFLVPLFGAWIRRHGCR